MSYLGNKPSDVFPTSFTVTNATVEGAFTSQGIDDNANANAITIDSSERVGISTSSPSKELDVVGTTRIEKSGQAINLDTPSASQNVWMNFSDNGSAKWEIQKNTANVLNIYSYDASANVMSFDGTGAITKPLQPAFLAHPTSAITNISTGANNTLAFATERFDQNSDYNNSTYTFTAPVTGKYQLNVSLYLTSLDSAVVYYELLANTSNHNYYTIFDPDFGQDNTYFFLPFSQLVDMDASDTCTINLFQQGGSSQTDISSLSMWSMYLVA